MQQFTDMRLKQRLYKLNIFSVYVYFVSFLMIGQVMVYRINEQFDWIIRKQFFMLLPGSLEQLYLSLLLLLLMFSLVNIFVIPIIGTFLGLRERKAFIVILSFSAAIIYYQLIYELRDGII